MSENKIIRGLTMKKEKKKLVVLFPGWNYSVDCPLLYYSDFYFETEGYDKLLIDYGDVLKNDQLTVEQRIEAIKENTLNKIQDNCSSNYEDIIFVSKSIGTVIAGWVQEQLQMEIRQIFLTPLMETLPYMHSKNCIVIAGTNDERLDSKILREYCKSNNVYLKQFEGANHSLERSSVKRSLDILDEIISVYELIM